MSLEDALLDALGRKDPSLNAFYHFDNLASMISVASKSRALGAIFPEPHAPASHWEETVALAKALQLEVTPRALGGAYVGKLPSIISSCSVKADGERFGYPLCCSLAYAEASATGIFRRYALQQRDLEDWGPALREWLSRHRYLAWAHHKPCELTCPTTRMQGISYMSAAHRAFPRLAPVMERVWLDGTAIRFGF